MGKIWICSAHGGVEMIQVGGRKCVPLVQLPKGVEFWTCSKESLVARPSMADFEKLIRGRTPMQTDDDLLTACNMSKFNGASVPNYTMTFTDEWGKDKWGYECSGIFISGDYQRRQADSWTPDPDTTYTLKEFLESDYVTTGDKIAWMCCRVWSENGQFMRHEYGMNKGSSTTAPE